MKSSNTNRMIIAGVAASVFCFSGSLQAQGGETATAKQALSILNGERGSEVMRGIVGLRAWDGQHQPKQWEIITTSQRGVQRYVVNGQRVLSTDSPGNVRVGQPMDLRALKVDSISAFRIADKQARAAQVGFDSIDYELRSQTGGYRPLWTLRLKDSYGQVLGSVDIDGFSGEIAGQNWNQQQSSYAQGPAGGGEYDGMYEGYDDMGAGQGYESVSYDDGGGSYSYNDYSDPRQPRIDYSNYGGELEAKRGRAEDYRHANYQLYERTAVDPVDAKEKAKNGFVKISDTFRDIFKGRAQYRSTGRNFHRANRVTRGRPR